MGLIAMSERDLQRIEAVDPADAVDQPFVDAGRPFVEETEGARPVAGERPHPSRTTARDGGLSLRRSSIRGVTDR
jgi:hypothetical protein